MRVRSQSSAKRREERLEQAIHPKPCDGVPSINGSSSDGMLSRLQGPFPAPVGGDLQFSCLAERRGKEGNGNFQTPMYIIMLPLRTDVGVSWPDGGLR